LKVKFGYQKEKEACDQRHDQSVEFVPEKSEKRRFFSFIKRQAVAREKKKSRNSKLD
jgi:hypothetical protein